MSILNASPSPIKPMYDGDHERHAKKVFDAVNAGHTHEGTTCDGCAMHSHMCGPAGDKYSFVTPHQHKTHPMDDGYGPTRVMEGHTGKGS